MIPKQEEQPKPPDYSSSPQQPQQPSAPTGATGTTGANPSMIPLFMKGPLAVPDPSLAVEEANYVKNMSLF